jgi:flavorubredoxin
MNTRLDEIASRIFRVSVYIPEADFMFNQFLVDGDEPLLFHTGPRQLFPIVSQAINQVRPVEELRWITFGHLEADECGAMNLFLTAAPHAQVAHGRLVILWSLALMRLS